MADFILGATLTIVAVIMARACGGENYKNFGNLIAVYGISELSFNILNWSHSLGQKCAQIQSTERYKNAYSTGKGLIDIILLIFGQ